MTVDIMNEKDDREYIEMKELLDDEELSAIAKPILSYLKATLSIRNKNVDCTVKDIDDKPRWEYPLGYTQIL